MVLSSNCSRQDSPALFKKPSPDALIDDVTIRLGNSPPRVYAYTDRIGGFWEGLTFNYHANGGYKIEGQPVFQEFMILKNDRLLDRRCADRADILPYQIRHTWNDSTRESITVLSNRNGMIISLESNSPASWSIITFFNAIKKHLKLTHQSSSNTSIIENKETGMITTFICADSGTWTPLHNKTDKSPRELAPLPLFGEKFVTTTAGKTYFILLFGTDKNKPENLALNPKQFIEQRKHEAYELLTHSYVKTNLPRYSKALQWAKISGDALVVKQFGKGIWAGLPWFHQSWGRDTFIALPGISLVTGQFNDAKDIIKSFANFQINDPQHPLYGRVPNRVISPADIIYNTTDGTPWLIREITEYIFYTGDVNFAREMFPVIKRAIEGAQKNFTDKSGFLTHDDADTWMDARIRGKQAWSPRGNRAVDIQALWYNQLQVSAFLARITGNFDQAEKWKQSAARVKSNFNDYFVNINNNTLYDHLNTDGSADHQIRPNQVFALTIPMLSALITPAIAEGVVKQVVSELTYPYGVASLSQNDPYFHPYHHDQIYHFDAAYHNGLCWHWIAGPVISGMVKLGYHNLAFDLTQNLAQQLIHQGMHGSLSELVEPAPNTDGTLTLTGTYSQAWSVSEFIRNFYQDYLGITANMIHREIYVAPRLPDSLNYVEFVFRMGLSESLECIFRKDANGEHYIFFGKTLTAPLTLHIKLPGADHVLYNTTLTLNNQKKLSLSLLDPVQMTATVNNKTHKLIKSDIRLPEPSPELTFQTFRLNPSLKTVLIPDYLEKIRLSERE